MPSSHGKKNHQLLKSRTYKFCRDEEFLATELSHLLQVFVHNGSFFCSRVLFIVNCVWGETKNQMRERLKSIHQAKILQTISLTGGWDGVSAVLFWWGNEHVMVFVAREFCHN